MSVEKLGMNGDVHPKPNLFFRAPSGFGAPPNGKSAQEGLPSDKFVRAKKKKGRSAYTEEVGEKRQRGVKLPKIGYTAEEWLTPLRPEEIPIPITIVDPSAEDMSRRNIPRPVIPTKSANPARTRGSSDEPLQQKEKRQKTSADVLQSGSVQRSPIEKGRTSSSKEKEGDVVPEPHIDLTNPEIEAEVLRQFSPSYTMPDGRVLLLKDSVKEEPNLAVTLLRGLALPRDYDQVPTDLMPGLAEMCSHLVQAGQAALKAYDKASKVSADRERFRNDRESFRAKWRSSDQQVKEKEDEVKHLNKELADAKAAADSFAAELKKMKEQEREKIQEADAKGYEAGIKRAALEYTQVAHKMVNDELEVRLPDFFKLGYAAGADAMAGVMAIQPESGFLKQLPEPVVPDLDLPYTEEECQPLPPEEDDEEAVVAPAADPESNVAMVTENVAAVEQTEV
ncbi:hypothetical protein RHSIM_Rhsim05G0211400 [Rhododendron simsii]|uniref:Uncharacterized protein n=1 Tax=Rhododendron simsii TaxID=118357 RepID=A0A834L7L4_RHOSS|nr:hypothetical protein RHSIM_Rhsim11G0150700 [Rhododendron simsii]KAF7143110.1 hypothetical protein RHSIM_Rhsim05G0211400 [Rhododendron simsii]